MGPAWQSPGTWTPNSAEDPIMLVLEIDPSRFFLGAPLHFVSKLKFFLGDCGGWKSTLSRKTSRKPTPKFVSDFVTASVKKSTRAAPVRYSRSHPPPPRLLEANNHDVPRRHTNEQNTLPRSSTNCHRVSMRRRSSCPPVGGRRPASGQY